MHGAFKQGIFFSRLKLVLLRKNFLDAVSNAALSIDLIQHASWDIYLHSIQESLTANTDTTPQQTHARPRREEGSRRKVGKTNP